MSDEYLADCIICAAGASRRMGEWKLNLPWSDVSRSSSYRPTGCGGSWLVDAVVAAALDAGCRVILVTGFRGDELEERFAVWSSVELVRNEHWETGMVSSVKSGLSRVRSSWFFVVHGDMPLIGPHWYRRLFGSLPYNVNEAEPLALRPMYGEQPGHPVLFSRCAIPHIQHTDTGDSLKSVLNRCKVIRIETEDSSVVYDVDTLEEYIHALTFSVQHQSGTQLGTVSPLEWGAPVKGAHSCVQLITGIQGAGKTSILRRKAFRAFIHLLKEGPSSRSLFVMLSQVAVGRGTDGRAYGFDIEALYRSPEGRLYFFRQALCRTKEWGPELSVPVTGGLILGPYHFDPGAFENLARWLTPALEKSGDAIQLYIDELGKLELDQQRGLWKIFQEFLHAFIRGPNTTNRSFVCTVSLDRAQTLAKYLEELGFSIEISDLSYWSRQTSTRDR